MSTAPESIEAYSTVAVEICGYKLDIQLDYLYVVTTTHQSFVTHDHAVEELYYIRQGSMTFFYDGQTYLLNAGDLFLIKSRKTHNIVSHSPDLDWFHIRFCFHDSDPINGCEFTYIPSPEFGAAIRETVDKIYGCKEYNLSTYDNYRLKAYLGILFSYIFEYIEVGNRGDRVDEQYNRLTLYTLIDSFLSEYCSREVTVDMLARRLRYSTVHTCRIVRECCGMTFAQKLREVRMRTAKRYLMQSDLPIDEIAARCGYKSRKGFEKAFFGYTQMTPSQYRHQGASS